MSRKLFNFRITTKRMSLLFVVLLTFSLVSLFANSMNKSTIYRILNKLEDDNIIHSFIGLHGLKWYAKCSGCTTQEHYDNHPHFQCENCNEVRCIKGSIQPSELIGSKFYVTKILLTGLCDRCFSSI